MPASVHHQREPAHPLPEHPPFGIAPRQLERCHRHAEKGGSHGAGGGQEQLGELAPECHDDPAVHGGQERLGRVSGVQHQRHQDVHGGRRGEGADARERTDWKLRQQPERFETLRKFLIKWKRCNV